LIIFGGILVQNVWRIIDANLNRASEGLRVVEEVARFILENEKLTQDIKQCRHRLAEVCRHPAFHYDNLVAARDAEGDVGGVHTYIPSEGQRGNYKEIVVANIKRVQEAARSLEEFGKLLCPEIGFGFKQFRFHTYTLEKALADALRCRERPAPAWNIYVTTGDCWCNSGSVAEETSRIIGGGAGIIQFWGNESTTRSLVETARHMREITQKAGVYFIVADRVDVALAVDADGVHIGQEDMQLKDVRRLLGNQKIIGVSARNADEACMAEQEGADYIGVGPIIAVGIKSDAQSLQYLELIRGIRKVVRIPCIAIGGINCDHIPEVIRAGANGAAVITAVASADDIRAATAKMKQIDIREKERQEI
jgi:thiamine-phosphate pyrophosphorylase